MSDRSPTRLIPSDAGRCTMMRRVPDQPHAANPERERCKFKAVDGVYCAVHAKMALKQRVMLASVLQAKP